MIQWKQRLYAFLLRRILGPFLDDESSKILHDSVDFSLQEGRFVLKDVSLNSEFLTEKVSANRPGLSISKAKVDRLEINLTLRENVEGFKTEDDTDGEVPKSSFAWKAIKFGSSTTSYPAVSLLAEIIIDGISLEVSTGVNRKAPGVSPKVDMTVQDDTSSKGLIASYVDAALASLQLHLKITKTNITIKHQELEKEKCFWMTVRLSSISYKDLDILHNNDKSGPKAFLNKSIEIYEIRLETGEEASNNFSKTVSLVDHTTQSTVALAEGSGQINLRVFKYDDEIEHCNVQNDVEIKLNHQLNFSIDESSLVRIKTVIDGLSNTSEITEEHATPEFSKTSLAGSPLDVNYMTDQEDLKILTGIMKQYKEAYHLAEKNQLKGGVLIPSDAYLEAIPEPEIDSTSFDLFFDANDQSFHNAASFLAESIRIQEDVNDDDIHLVSTKIRFHLLGASLKVVFQERTSKQFSTPEEYILLTVEDVTISHTSSNSSSHSTLNIVYMQIEDAQLDRSRRSPGSFSSGGYPIVEGIVDIGTFLGVGSESNFGEDELLVSDAPGINLIIMKEKVGAINTIRYDATIAPIEVCFRQRTLSNLSNFASRLKAFTASSSKDSKVHLDDETPKNVSFYCSSPSIEVRIPLVRHVSTGPLFERFGERPKHLLTKEASLGVIFLNTAIELSTGPTLDSDERLDSGKFVANQMLLFVESPVGDNIAVDTQMQRVDVCLVSGRVEVNPCIPISIEFKKSYNKSQKAHNGRNSFPLVPAISSFKARQEDDDEDIKTDRLLFSKLTDVNADSRKELRGSDPQYAMLSDVEKADVVVILGIPEITAELTKTEIETLLKVIEATMPMTSEENQSGSSQEKEESNQWLSLSVNFDKISFSLREDASRDSQGQNVDVYSYLLAIDKFKVHALKQGPSMKHVRILAHDPCLYEIYHNGQEGVFDQVASLDINSRFAFFKKRMQSFARGSVSPLFFRSKLFPPISQESPSLLFDYINLSSNTPTMISEFIQKRLHVTLYHLTHRYDVDSKWISRVKSLIPQTKSESSSDDQQSTDHSVNQIQSMTKVFFSLTDFNLDYTPPAYFETQSRSIMRIGDFRFSSNIMKPPVVAQAYSLSLGDFSFNICNHKYPHDDENSVLCRSSIMWDQHSGANASSSLSGSAPETLLRELEFVNVLSLDLMDAIVVVRDDTSFKSTKEDLAPSTMTSLSFGLLSMHACKDSFSCFATTVGELQAKVSALSDEDMKALAKESTARIRRKERNSSSRRQTSKEQTSLLKPQDLAPSIAKSLLLDGYEWTTIDHDPLPEIEIPDGDEQVATWYDDPNQFNDDGPVLGLPRINPQHFPLHAISDPLADGDMGASKFAESDAVLGIKSRLLIHRLTVKFRFFDGYDWPLKMSAEQLKVAKLPNATFVIGILPERERLEMKEELRKSPEAAAARKAKLMGDLLDSPGGKSATFSSVPLPVEKAVSVEQKEKIRRYSRKPHLFFQLSANGVTLRIDSFKEDKSHSLVSILALSVSDLFIAETASSPSPIKMLGEWVNDKEHARDTRFGTLMFKMATWHPTSRLTTENEIESDECEVTMQLLPMRILLDQRALDFIRAFFHSEEKDEEGKTSEKWSAGLHYLPPPRFLAFRVKPWKLKVDYLPQKLDFGALREGSFVELVNISPIDGMVITLSQACVEDVVGGGGVFGGLLRNWVQEICATQLHKFLSSARPFEPIADVGQATTDLVVLPYEAFKNGDDIRRAMGSGIKSLAETFAFQTLTTTSRLTQYAANKMAGTVRGRKTLNVASNPLPSRPSSTPKGVGDVTGHAMQSLARGFQAANHKVVIVPYREYVRTGATGAASSVIRGVPVLLVAPLTGATEALSYTLLGARNALRPDIRKEEEAIRNGIGYDN